MADIIIPNLNNKSKQYLFKNKLTLKKKSKSKLLKESLYMLILSALLFAINYLIPNKNQLFGDFTKNLLNMYMNFSQFLGHFFQIIIVCFLVLSSLTSLLLLFGAFYRIFKVTSRKSRKIFL